MNSVSSHLEDDLQVIIHLVFVQDVHERGERGQLSPLLWHRERFVVPSTELSRHHRLWLK